jgi:cytochrome c oxidase subunit 1
MQLAWPEQSFKIFNVLLGDKFADGVMANDIYLALNYSWNHNGIFVLTAALSGTFSNLLIPLQIGARDMASGFMNMISYWLFFISSVIMISSLFVGWSSFIRLDYLSAIVGIATGYSWVRYGYDLVVDFYGYIYCFLFNGVFKLYSDGY